MDMNISDANSHCNLSYKDNTAQKNRLNGGSNILERVLIKATAPLAHNPQTIS